MTQSQGEEATGLLTFFAPAQRATAETLTRQISIVSNSPVVDGVMKTAGGLMAVLNKERQILAVNDTLLKSMGIQDTEEVLGLRPGEAICCVNADSQPGGCGTGRVCSTCGAAIAIVTALDDHAPQEKECIVTVEKNGVQRDLCLAVRACPIIMEGDPFILLFLQDVTAHRERAELERIFFHDLSNTISALQGTSELLNTGGEEERALLMERMQQLISRLTDELTIQKMLLYQDDEEYVAATRPVSLIRVIEELRDAFAGHPAAEGKVFKIQDPPPLTLRTDPTLLLRVLTNMVANALEATEKGKEVKMWIERDDDRIAFCVWNVAFIPEPISKRIFQRHFTTKKGTGRGLGTYSMKWIGERLLGGRIVFETSETEGTLFRFVMAQGAVLDE